MSASRPAEFTAWNTFKKLSAGPIALTKNKAETIKLKQGGASVMLRDRTEKRVELTVNWDGPDGITAVTRPTGDGRRKLLPDPHAS